MKKALFLAVLLFAIRLTCVAQIIVNPNVEVSESPTTIITKIESDKQYTVVSFTHYAPTENSWIVLNKEIYIQSDVDNKHYDYVKSEGVAVAPQTKNIIKKANDKLEFKVYFKKIPETAKHLDIIERAGKRGDGINFMNFYHIDLSQSQPGDQGVKTTSVVLMPPPPVNGMWQPSNGANEMANAMNAMGPMYTSMAKSVLDAQLDYYKQPGKITEIAKLNKAYFDALVKEGFTTDQALKILTANSIIPKSASINGQ